MRKKYKPIPIAAARRIIQQYDKNQVVIIAWDEIHQTQHITTCGKSLQDSREAAEAGNHYKQLLGWPDELCHDMPARVKRADRLKAKRAAGRNI